MKTTRRFGPESSATRTLLPDATERLMLEEGYAAVSTRRVAREVGLTPAPVRYYFNTTDDLHPRRDAGGPLVTRARARRVSPARFKGSGRRLPS